jgi:hypothetical protein
VRRHLASCATLLLLACARPATAQVFGQFTGAVPVGVDARLCGTYVSFTKNEAELLAQLRLSFYPGLDFGFHGGLAHVTAARQTRTAVELGGDLKNIVAHRSPTMPFDFSLGGAIGVSSAEDINVLSVGPTAVASRAYDFGARAQITPYLGAALLYSRSSLDNSNTTDVSLPVRFGLEYRPNAEVSLIAELQTAGSQPPNDGSKLILGANFPF